jgi:hypothetical protein
MLQQANVERSFHIQPLIDLSCFAPRKDAAQINNPTPATCNDFLVTKGQTSEVTS